MSKLSEIQLEAGGRTWRLVRPASLDELWEGMVQEGSAFEDERIPYWVELWPSSIALAEWLGQCKAALKGRLCIDLGCGLGLSALAGVWLGARVLALDYEENALVHLRQNVLLNALTSPWLAVMDWRNPALRRGAAELVWGADIVYEKRFARPILDFLALSLADGGRAWIAEPGRNIFDHFLKLLPESGFAGKVIHESHVKWPGNTAPEASVAIWELTRRV